MYQTRLDRIDSIIRHLRTQRNKLVPSALGCIALVFTLSRGLGAESQQAATAVATVTNGSLDSVTLTSGGSGYTAPPAVTFVGGGGTGASAIAQISDGVVTAIIIQSPGSGYTDAPAVSVDPPAAQVTPATLNISLVPKLTITGQAWAVQSLQYADALGDPNQWITWTNIVMGEEPIVLADLAAPPGGRFYRVVTASPGPDPARWAWINPGTFAMGSSETEYDRSADESPQTAVTIGPGFWMERFEVTQDEYTEVAGTNSSYFPGDPNQPVEQVSWYDASNYCALLTMQERAGGRVPAGYEYRLPTEAEWEYATRAGTTNRFFFGDDHSYTQILDYAWIATNSDQTTHAVGRKQPNPWGIYDMQGNVWEWCADWYGPYSGGSITNPPGASSGANRVMRGGSWRFPGGDARSAARNFNPPDFASDGVGIRVVLGRAQ